MGGRREGKDDRKWVGENLLSGLLSTIPVHPMQIKVSRNLKKFSTAAEAGAAPGGWGKGIANCELQIVNCGSPASSLKQFNE
jgi:hypothetical protein